MTDFRKLKAEEIEARVSRVYEKGAVLLLYKTARVDRAVLDETYKNRWQNDFKVIDGKMYGGIGIYDEELKEWIWRWDCGTESNTAAEKGEASDCFKRAGFKWGIGVELYSAPFIFVSVPTEKKGNGWAPKNPFQKFDVTRIAYDDGEISELEIRDDKGALLFSWQKKGKTKQPAPNNRTATREAEGKKAPPAPDIVGKFNETFAKLQKTPDNSIDLNSDKAKKQIEFMNDLLTALKAEGFNKNAEQLEKLFNQKLKKPAQAA